MRQSVWGRVGDMSRDAVRSRGVLNVDLDEQSGEQVLGELGVVQRQVTVACHQRYNRVSASISQAPT